MSIWILSPRGAIAPCCDCKPDICDTCLCPLSVSGSDTPYEQEFSATNSGSSINIQIDFEAYTKEDQLKLDYYWLGSWYTHFDTGCQTGFSSTLVGLPGFYTKLRIKVIPNCTGGTGTIWDFDITCP